MKYIFNLIKLNDEYSSTFDIKYESIQIFNEYSLIHKFDFSNMKTFLIKKVEKIYSKTSNLDNIYGKKVNKININLNK